MVWRQVFGRVGMSAAATACGIALAWFMAPAAAAADDPEPEDPTTWSVRPSNAEGRDERTWAELTLDPGEDTTDYLVVDNFSDHDITFGLAAADGLFTENGRFTVLPPWQESTDAGRWIDLPDSVDVPAHQATVVPYTVSVPTNATPGDHPAGVVASLTPGDASRTGVALDARVGFRVMVRVTGELEPALQVEAEARYATAWNPFSPGVLTVDYTVRNTGNLRLGASPSVRAGSLIGPTAVKAAEEITEFAPGDSRSGTITLRRVWPWGVIDVEIAADGRMTVDQPGVEPPTASVTVQVVAVPWPQIVLVLAAAALFFAWRHGRRKQERVFQQRLDEAHRRGVREGETKPNGSGTDGTNNAAHSPHAVSGGEPTEAGTTGSTPMPEPTESAEPAEPTEESATRPEAQISGQRRSPRHAFPVGGMALVAAVLGATLTLPNSSSAWADPVDVDDQGVDITVVIEDLEEDDGPLPVDPASPSPSPDETEPTGAPATSVPPRSPSEPPTSVPAVGDVGDVGEQLEWTGTSQLAVLVLAAIALAAMGWALRRRAARVAPPGSE
ncbi:MAG: hypothetical protein LBK95_18670 [Bifidobacteriaceae bacterium]|jgi:hypothetical protein|nr:hypothetical protein [Bifidobacteriaceae bacterium]